MCLAWALAACGDDGQRASQASGELAAAGTLEVDLPPGVEVSIGGVSKGRTPLTSSLEIAADVHSVALKTACGEETVNVRGVAGKPVALGRADVKTLKFAKLDVVATTLDAKPLAVEVSIDEVALGDGQSHVPACGGRMRVAAQGYGTFIEDVDFEAEPKLSRALVLTPGPDVVRIHGGPFKAGPHPVRPKELPDATFTLVKPHHTEVQTFDIDRTEVTAGEFMACVNAGGCENQPMKAHRARVKNDEPCNYTRRYLPEEERSVRMAVEGREDLPANCITFWEADSYCEWRGRRLPTPVEFDYAARSRKSEYRWPWGTDESECRTVGWQSDGCAEYRDSTSLPKPWGHSYPNEACSFPNGNSEQGVCDLAGNLQEFVADVADYESTEKHQLVGGEYASYVNVFEPEWNRDNTWLALTYAGFRCANPIEAERTP